MQAKALVFAIVISIFLLLVGGFVGFWIGRGTAPTCPETVARTSVTSTVRDTVSRPVPAPQVSNVVRVDTVRLKIKPAKKPKSTAVSTNPTPSVSLNADPPQADAEALVPITRKVYQTPDYRAVVSGFRPSLDSMQVFRETRTITETVTKLVQPKKKWLALTAGPQVGVDVNGQVVPSIGVTLGIILISK